MTSAPHLVAPPARLWRVGRGDDPLKVHAPASDPGSSRAGNRFDSPSGTFSCLYFGADQDACFGEVLARFRPDTGVMALVAEEWEAAGFMKVGAVPAEWRARRTIAEVSLPEQRQFLDLEDRRTHNFLERELSLGLSSLGYKNLDVAAVRGDDRRVSRLIAEWAFNWEPEDTLPLGGIRYLSRLNDDWECWAVFHDVAIDVQALHPINLQNDSLQKIAELFELTAF